MKNFTYFRPTSLEAAVALLDATYGATELLAGGTDLLDLQKEYVAQPDKVVSLSGLGADFRKITVGTGTPPTVEIGAGATLADIADHKDLRELFPGLTTAAAEIGGPQIRNMGTLGGNLCQRNRCWYFRDEGVSCLLKGGRKCYATDGDNRYHAVFTSGHKCVIVNPSTLAPVLIALKAEAEVFGPKGKRTLPLDKFFRAPESAEHREHVLAANEIVTKVTLKAGPRNGSYEVRHKQSYDWPLVQAAVAFDLEGGTARNVRVVLGHVAPTPHIAEAAAKALEGKRVTEETAVAAGKAATEGARPLSGNAYKVKLIEVAVKRAALLAAGAKPYWT
ncbi:MAG: xanthine dehydrogenase family protein subunit M [Gemmatales bacterium]|nr:xanthine dehydrogenase family protein subunit M [Gemmatales bacterium]MDW8387553.1 xanthine dehydrogenase family protein subunit M [Gemmatales bacterium]